MSPRRKFTRWLGGRSFWRLTIGIFLFAVLMIIAAIAFAVEKCASGVYDVVDYLTTSVGNWMNHRKVPPK